MNEPKVSVGIIHRAPQIAFVWQGEKQVASYDTACHKIVWKGEKHDTLLFEPQDEANDSFELLDVTIGINFHWERKENQRFLGALKLIVEGEGITAINLIRVEEYLTSVISSEMSATASLELLKAHAVISRSWVLRPLPPTPFPVGRGRGYSYYQTADALNYRLLKGFQEELKHEPTEAEKIIWERVRRNQLGTKFRRQHVVDNYIADFISLEKKLIIKIDGEYHNTLEQQEKDNERTESLNILGYQILRFANNEVIAQPDVVIDKIKDYIDQSCEEHIRWYERDAHKNFDICADDHCQRYQGITRASTERVKEAIAATRGEVLTYNGEICDARFSKCCGGITEEFQYCWDYIKYPYLKGKRDYIPPRSPRLPLPMGEGAGGRDRPFCNCSDGKILSQVLNNYDQETTNFYRWQVEYTQAELSALILQRSGVDYGDIIDLIPLARGTSGRIWKLKIVGSKRTMVIGKELEIRRTLSPSHLYSSAFVVDKEGSIPATPSEEKEEKASEGITQIPARFRLTGAGWGHGVGLCQIGAAVMGEQGYSYQEILLHYYTGAEIGKLYP